MPRSKNPHDYGLYITDTLDLLLNNTPPRYTFPMPDPSTANRIRREFYAYKQALNTYIIRAKQDDPELDFFIKYRRAFSMYQMRVATYEGKSYLLFEHRDESDLATIMAKATAHAHMDTQSIHDLTDEQKESFLQKHKEMKASGALPGSTAGSVDKSKFGYDPLQTPLEPGLPGRKELTTGDS